MLIELSEILSAKDKSIDVQADIEMQQFTSKMCDYRVVDKSSLLINLHNTGKRRFTLSTDINLSLLIPCDRCLEEVKHIMNIKVNKDIDMNESENNENQDDKELFFIEGDELDVEKLVYNEVLVNLPMKILCSENCKGICNRCGANLNSQTCDCDTTELDPRMSKIRDIFNNFKEV